MRRTKPEKMAEASEAELSQAGIKTVCVERVPVDFSESRRASPA